MIMRAFIFSCVATLALAGAAFAQQPPVGGPLVLEPVRDEFVVSPEVKLTDFDHHVGTLVGATAGALVDKQLFLGGGGYGLVHQSGTNRGFGYGGFVIGWLFDAKQPVTVTAKALLGFGTAWQSQSDQIYVPYCTGPGNRTCSAAASSYYYPYGYGYHSHTGFLVAEPEIDVAGRVGQHVRLSAGIGYRATDEPWGYDLRTGGLTASFSALLTLGK